MLPIRVTAYLPAAPLFWNWIRPIAYSAAFRIFVDNRSIIIIGLITINNKAYCSNYLRLVTIVRWLARGKFHILAVLQVLS